MFLVQCKTPNFSRQVKTSRGYNTTQQAKLSKFTSPSTNKTTASKQAMDTNAANTSTTSDKSIVNTEQIYLGIWEKVWFYQR